MLPTSSSYKIWTVERVGTVDLGYSRNLGNAGFKRHKLESQYLNLTHLHTNNNILSN